MTVIDTTSKLSMFTLKEPPLDQEKQVEILPDFIMTCLDLPELLENQFFSSKTTGTQTFTC